MSRLLGMAFNHPIIPSLFFQGFDKESEIKPSGWGLALYHKNSIQVFKEPLTSGNHLSTFLKNYPLIKSHILIGQVRYNSVGDAAYQNTHPFQREFRGREFVFAHNGTLSGYEEDFENPHFKPVGKTDSEAAFCHILDRVKDEGCELEEKDYFNWLKSELNVMNDYGDLNCIFSDGEHLFTYHDEKGHNALYYLLQRTPFEEVSLEDDDYQILLSGDNTPYQRGYIIATNPLNDDKWQSFRPGELMVVKNGETVYRR